MKAQLAFWLLLGLAALLVCWSIGASRRLKRLHAAARVAFVLLDRALCSQIDFVRGTKEVSVAGAERPSAVDAAQDPGISARAAADQLAAVLAALRARPLAPASMAALSVALAALLHAWQRLQPGTSAAVALLDSHLDPHLDPRVDSHLGPHPRVEEPRHWPEPSAAAELARADFNRAVFALNAALRQFPASWLAPLLGLRAAGVLA